MPRKPLFDLTAALEAVDFVARCGGFNRRDRGTGHWVPSPASVDRVKKKVVAELYLRRAAHQGSRKGVGGSREVPAKGSSGHIDIHEPSVTLAGSIYDLEADMVNSLTKGASNRNTGIASSGHSSRHTLTPSP